MFTNCFRNTLSDFFRIHPSISPLGFFLENLRISSGISQRLLNQLFFLNFSRNFSSRVFFPRISQGLFFRYSSRSFFKKSFWDSFRYSRSNISSEILQSLRNFFRDLNARFFNSSFMEFYRNSSKKFFEKNSTEI